MNSHPQRVIIKRNWTSIKHPCYDSFTSDLLWRSSFKSAKDFSLTSDLFMTFYRVVLYARMVFLLLLYTLTTTSIVTQSHIRTSQRLLHTLHGKHVAFTLRWASISSSSVPWKPNRSSKPSRRACYYDDDQTIQETQFKVMPTDQ